MADSAITITQGAGTNIDTRTETTNSQHRQVVVIGDPAINADVAAVASQDVASTDQTTPAVLVRVAGSATVVGLQGSTARPLIMNSDGAIKVYDLVNGTVGVENITRVRNVVDGTLSLVTRVDRVFNLVDGTITTVTGVDRVRNVVDGTISTVTRTDRVFNLVDGTISSGTLDFITRVRNLVDGTLTTVTGVDRVRNIVDGTMSTVVRVSNIIDGTISLANIQATAVVNAAGGSVAGSTAAVSASGLTLVSPEAGRNIKVYAFSLTTTAQVGGQIRFTNGAGTSPTVFWQVALQAPSQGIAGANLAVTPPGYLFATGSNVTLSLVKDSASLLHYSVSYFKESS